MKPFTKKSIATYVTFAILIVFLTGAQCTIGECTVTFNDYSAKAVNVKAETDSATDFFKDEYGETDDLVGATVSIYAYESDGSYSDNAYATTSVSSSGTFTFYSPESNLYKLTGEKDGWVFVPQYIEITNNGSTAKDLLAFPEEDAGVYTVVTSWETDDVDVDMILTYGDEDGTNVVEWNNHTEAPDGTRYKIGYGAPGSSDGISHDRDVDGSDPDIPKVETISIHEGVTDWVKNDDTIKIYLDTSDFSGDTLTGYEGNAPSAYAQVDIVEYNSSNGESTHFGTWYIPWNTNETTIQIIQAEMTIGGLDIYSANNAIALNGTGTGYTTGIRSLSE